MHDERFSPKLIAVIITGILWNPIMPIYLDKDMWVVLDAAAIAVQLLLIISLIISKRKI